jgi:NAD(P)-dependent dehydrogenase (short-subunit alcohol dehydrogenase family)
MKCEARVNLEGSIGLVTGGASGLGRATVEALIERGATVVVLDRPNALASVEAETRRIPAPGDVTDPSSVAAAVAEATRRGPPRFCINCAGVDGPEKVARRGAPADLDTFRRVIEVNLIGTFNVTRLVAAEMQRSERIDGERGVIVNTASIAAFDGQKGQASYAASKGGITAMTLPLARDLANDGIRCATIAPGLFDTPLLSALPEPVYSSLAAAVPYPSRLGQVEEFAQLAVHIIANPYLNGEVIRLDGALRLGAAR